MQTKQTTETLQLSRIEVTIKQPIIQLAPHQRLNHSINTYRSQFQLWKFHDCSKINRFEIAVDLVQSKKKKYSWKQASPRYYPVQSIYIRIWSAHKSIYTRTWRIMGTETYQTIKMLRSSIAHMDHSYSAQSRTNILPTSFFFSQPPKTHIIWSINQAIQAMKLNFSDYSSIL